MSLVCIKKWKYILCLRSKHTFSSNLELQNNIDYFIRKIIEIVW